MNTQTLSDMATQTGPLHGIRVLDLTSVVMGPLATQMLADLGADVIKIEAPAGDPIRAIGPCGEHGVGPLFLGLNRNKRSVVLNLKTPQGKEALLRLARDADVLATNVRPAAMQRLGLGYAACAAVNPQLVYASMVGFSQRGPYAAKPAYDDMIQAATGMAAVAGQAAGGAPYYPPMTIADRAVGLYAFGVICAALVARNHTGQGQQVDIPMFETMTPFVLGDHLYGHTFVPPQGDFSYPRLMTRHRRPYKTRDGYVCCLIYTDRQWQVFLNAIGKGDLWHTDARFKTLNARTQAIDALYQFVSDELAQRTTAQWQQLLPEEQIVLFPMHTVASLLQDEHLVATGFFQQTQHPVVGGVLETAVPSEWSATPPTRQRHAPILGEHTLEVLRAAGYADAEIDVLTAAEGAATDSAENSA